MLCDWLICLNTAWVKTLCIYHHAPHCYIFSPPVHYFTHPETVWIFKPLTHPQTWVQQQSCAGTSLYSESRTTEEAVFLYEAFVCAEKEVSACVFIEKSHYTVFSAASTAHQTVFAVHTKKQLSKQQNMTSMGTSLYFFSHSKVSESHRLLKVSVMAVGLNKPRSNLIHRNR